MNLPETKLFTPPRKNRIDYIDMIKGFTILWVVLHHINPSLNGFLTDYVHAPYRMPMFFLLSGFFFRDNIPFKTFIVKKTNQLIVPWVFFWLSITMLKIIEVGIKGIIKGFDLDVIFENVVSTLGQPYLLFTMVDYNPIKVGAIWFFLGLFMINLFYYIIRRISTNNYFLLITSLVIYYLYYAIMQPPLLGAPVKGALFYSIHVSPYLMFFVLGNLYLRKFIDFISNNKYICITIPSILFLISIQFSINIIFVRLIQSLLFAMIVIGIFSLLNTKTKKYLKFLTFFGLNSGIILGTHMFEMHIVIPGCVKIGNVLSINPTMSYLVALITCIALLFPTIWFINKYFYKYTGKYNLIPIN